MTFVVSQHSEPVLQMVKPGYFLSSTWIHSKEGGSIGILERFHLKVDLSGLALVLGLLSNGVSFHRDSSWLESPNPKSIHIIDATERGQRFFTYFGICSIRQQEPVARQASNI